MNKREKEKALEEAGMTRIRNGKGDHEIYESGNGTRVSLDMGRTKYNKKGFLEGVFQALRRYDCEQY